MVTYEELIQLQRKYGGVKNEKQKFTVLAFPSNDFHQETGTNEEIASFVQEHFFINEQEKNNKSGQFPVFAKSSLKDNPVYQQLSSSHPLVHDKQVQWNFYKYLVSGNGIAVAIYDHLTTPLSIENVILQLIHSQE